MVPWPRICSHHCKSHKEYQRTKNILILIIFILYACCTCIWIFSRINLHWLKVMFMECGQWVVYVPRELKSQKQLYDCNHIKFTFELIERDYSWHTLNNRYLCECLTWCFPNILKCAMNCFIDMCRWDFTKN